ncbi:hypothetical protein [Mumia zhuanghuii]|uniref:hypothetical protein n=1 Tax=Mumia zhuanghuii TaxID=2585211 RepID=UPI00129CC8C0|nr:hypothetical protein [Mumia zhuanghuii]
MKLFHRKSLWERAAERVPGGPMVRRGAMTAAGLIGVSVASAAVSAMRERQRP